MNAETRHAAIMTATAIRAIGPVLHATPIEQSGLDHLGWCILTCHAEGGIDFEGFCPLNPDFYGMDESQIADATIENAFQWLNHWGDPDCEWETIRYSFRTYIVERLTAEIARIRESHRPYFAA